MTDNSGVYWCENCQVPLLSAKCDICGQTNHHAFAKDLTPVFAEELTLLRNTLGFAGLPQRSKDYYLWHNGQSYFRYGEKLATISYDTEGSPNVTYPKKIHTQRRAHRAANLKDLPHRLYLANRGYLNELIEESIQFIRKCIATHPQDISIVTFSGGKDSTVVSHLVLSATSQLDVMHVMSDTTIETKDTYAFLETFRKKYSQTPLIVLQPTVNFWEVSKNIGPPSRIIRWCCSSHKTSPISRILSCLMTNNNGVLAFDGIRASESVRRKRYSRITYNHKIAGEILISPIQHWRNIDVWAYILTNELLINKMYKYGFRRVGCWPCPFNSMWSNYLLQQYYKRQFLQWQNLLLEYGAKIGHPDPHQFALKGWRVRAGGRGTITDSTKLIKLECLNEDNMFTYELRIPINEGLFHFLSPFGRLNKITESGIKTKYELMRDSEHKFAHIEIIHPRNTIRVKYYHQKYLNNAIQRFEKQLKKYQSCIACGACASYCRNNALNVNGKYFIDPDKCTHCLLCVKAPCIAVESLTKKGKQTRWGSCDGSI